MEENWNAAVDAALAKGGGPSLIRGFRRIGLRLFPADVAPSVHAYSNAVAYKVSLLADDVDQPHRDARLVRHGVSFQLVGGQAGHKLDQGGELLQAEPAQERDPWARQGGKSDREAEALGPRQHLSE